MKHFRLAALLGAATFLGITASSFAQTMEQPAPARNESAPRVAHIIKIKHAPSALIAYWLDPKHNARPVAWGDLNINQFGAPRKEEEKGAFTLPGSIERIASIDAQNAISIVGGSSEDILRLQEIVEVLDQPLRQVELQAQFVEMSADDVSQFGVDFSDGKKIGFVRNNFTARLDALIADGRAKVVSAPRVTTINNMPTIMNAATPPTNGNAPAWVYNIVPTVNSDETITLLLHPVEKGINLSTIANLRDGDTIALLVEIVSQSADATTAAKTNLVFLTPRIIRRAGDMK